MTLLTPWGESVDPQAPLPDYPRPQLVRRQWQCLNGPWQYAITPFASDDPTAVTDPTGLPRSWDGQIVVPFSPETPLSGVGRTLQPDETLWYRRTLTLDAPPRADERVILHLDAVDQSCRVAVDGTEVGGHTGGYLPVILDITDALTPGCCEHEIVVAVRDVTDASWLARGKQSRARGGIWYTPQSGIWQTAWLETIPRIAVDGLGLTPHLDSGELEVSIRATHAVPGQEASVRIVADGAVVASGSVPVGAPSRLALPSPVRAWSPEDPFCYDVQVSLGRDEVRSYVGMRSLGVGPDAAERPRLLLNGRPYLPVGLLDQGYWPDGGYTAPSDAALAWDIALARRLGYTMLRKHITVEPLRWYHHCDRLGMLVWQDAVNGGTDCPQEVTRGPELGARHLDDSRHDLFGRASAVGRERFEAELAEMIEHLRSVPSIGLWVPFNEGWGQFDAARIAELVRRLDPTRPVDHASGWHDQGAGDVRSLHVYVDPVRAPEQADGRVLALTEYGGYSLAVPGHAFGDEPWGYRGFRTSEELQVALERLAADELVPAIKAGLAALVYTQLADVEDEVNGLVTYDRRVVKVDQERMRRMNGSLRAAVP